MNQTVPAARPETCAIWVQVRPRSSREEVRGWTADGFLEVLVQAPPSEGEANRACGSKLARALGIAPSQVVLEKGHSSRRKKFRVHGLNREEVEARLSKWCKGDADQAL